MLVGQVGLEHGRPVERSGNLARTFLAAVVVDGHAGALAGAIALVLDDWDEVLPNFVKVMPHDLKRVLRERQEAELEVAS